MENKECRICGKEIDVPETALKLCANCFNENCICGHKRANHVNNNGSCIHQYNLIHKTKRGQFCSCKKFRTKIKMENEINK